MLVNLWVGPPLTWKSGKNQGKTVLMKKSGKFMKNFQSHRKGRENAIVFSNVDIARFIPIFCQRISWLVGCV